MSPRQEDFLFAEHVLRRGFATEQQVEECLGLLERLRGEMQIDETLAGILLKKGYLAEAQAGVIEGLIHGEKTGRAKNQIEGYQLQSRLGSGAMGSVYKAQHLKLAIPVALKVLRVELAKNRTQVERLKREAQLAARLSHPNVVRSIDVGESNGFHYIAMEFVDGATVRTLLRSGPLREREALRIVREVARGLEHAHEEGVVHRDVKPGNIILTREGGVKLADFGLARGQEPSDLTLDNASIGTPQYLAPEQARRAQDANARSDLFSLGATLYHMVTGRPPFSGDSLGEIFQKVLFCEFDPPETVVDELGIDTIYLIHRLMRGNPRERYPSSTALLEDLARVEAGERIAPADFRGDYQAFLKRRRGRRLAIGAAAIVVIAVSALLTTMKLTALAEERERTAACARIDATAEGEVAALDSLAALEQKLGEMEAARAGRACPADSIRELTARIEKTRIDVEQMRRAVALVEDAQREGADYRTIHARLRDLKAVWPGARRRIAEFAEQVARLSRHRALERYDEVYQRGFADRAAALEGLTAFEAELRGRFVALPDAWVDDVVRDAGALRELDRKWRQADDAYREQIDGAVERRHYDDAHRYLDARLTARRELRNAAILKDLDEDVFLQHYPESDPLRSRLVKMENDEWDEVSRQALLQTEAGRPDAARDTVLIPFLKRAERTRRRVEERIATVDGTIERLLRRQRVELRTREELFEDALRDRQYGRAWQLVDRVRDTTWILDARDAFRDLDRRAGAMRTLADGFPAAARRHGRIEVRFPREEGGVDVVDVPGDAIAPHPDDPDLFVAALERGARRFHLRDVPFDVLRPVFAFDRDSAEGRARRGYFLAAEAFRFDGRNPPRAAELREQALADLDLLGDPWYARVSVRREVNLENARKAEAEARRLRDSIERAVEAGNDLKALADCEALRRLTFTSTYASYRERLSDLLPGLRRRAKARLDHLRSGVPADNYELLDTATLHTRIRYTGRVWFKDEGLVPRDVVDPTAWLEEKNREFWLGHLARQEGLEGPELLAEYERARTQLRDWYATDGSRIQAGDGFYRLVVPQAVRAPFGPAAGSGLWFNQDILTERDNSELDDRSGTLAAEPLRVLYLRNHFDPSRPWSIECTVTWPPGTEPTLFALTAGSVQGVLVWCTEPYGGAKGVAVLEDPQFENELARQLKAFHLRLVEDRRRRERLNPQRGRAYLDSLTPGAPYRLRLERTRRGVRFLGAPLSVWEQAGGFDAIDPARETLFFEVADRIASFKLERALDLPGHGRVFRFYGHVNPAISDVVVTGFQPEPPPE